MTAPASVARGEDNEWLPDESSCPNWCDRSHAQALAEGNSWEDSREHYGAGYGDHLQELRNPIDQRVMRPGGGGWDLSLRQQPSLPERRRPRRDARRARDDRA